MPIFPFFFLGNTGQENVFYDILERENAFLDYKKKNFKKSKNWHFSKRVNPWFWSKNGHFSNFYFLGNIGQENVFYPILDRKRLLGYKNQEVQKVEKLTFFQRVLVQKWPFFQLFCLGTIGQGNVFYDILDQKIAFLAIKTRSSKSRKIGIFPNGLVHGFG